MRRLYFLVPNLDSASRIVDELLLARVPESHIHIVAREGTALQDLPEASLLQKSDLIPAVQRGLAFGGVAGLIGGVLAVTFPPAGLVLGGGAILGTALAGAGIGAFASSLVGIGIPNSRLREFEQAIADGHILLLVDIATSKVEPIEGLIRSHHAEIEICHTEPRIPAFP